jgi:hypothetical protein
MLMYFYNSVKGTHICGIDIDKYNDDVMTVLPWSEKIEW